MFCFIELDTDTHLILILIFLFFNVKRQTHMITYVVPILSFYVHMLNVFFKYSRVYLIALPI
jgi:hypothetical protein